MLTISTSKRAQITVLLVLKYLQISISPIRISISRYTDQISAFFGHKVINPSNTVRPRSGLPFLNSTWPNLHNNLTSIINQKKTFSFGQTLQTATNSGFCIFWSTSTNIKSRKSNPNLAAFIEFFAHFLVKLFS